MGKLHTKRPRLSLASEFNNFLYERIGSGGCDTQLSVVSALARLGLDPWVEADRLSRLPDESATGSLSAILSRLPETTLGLAGRQQTAKRLVELLPKRILVYPDKNTIRRASRRRLLPWIIVAALLCAFPLLEAGQLFWQTHYGASARQIKTKLVPGIPASSSKIGE